MKLAAFLLGTLLGCSSATHSSMDPAAAEGGDDAAPPATQTVTPPASTPAISAPAPDAGTGAPATDASAAAREAGTSAKPDGAAAMAGGPTDARTATGGQVWTIMTGNFYARPGALTIKVGDAVKWVRVDGEHNIIAAAVQNNQASCEMPTADFGPLTMAPATCVQNDGIGHGCTGCPGGYAMGPYCVGPHNVTAGYTVTFDKPGAFGFIDTRNNHCKIGIKGVITVMP